jgi:hypothetical protein
VLSGLITLTNFDQADPKGTGKKLPDYRHLENRYETDEIKKQGYFFIPAINILITGSTL